MHDSKVRSRLKAQLSKFTSELCGGLSKPLTKFVPEMLYGIQSSQDVKLSNTFPVGNEGDRTRQNLNSSVMLCGQYNEDSRGVSGKSAQPLRRRINPCTRARAWIQDARDRARRRGCDAAAARRNGGAGWF